ncbi:unnamed protein product, partial [Sphacelaria rigidula]
KARVVVEEFLSLYETHVLQPLSELENGTGSDMDTDQGPVPRESASRNFVSHQGSNSNSRAAERAMDGGEQLNDQGRRQSDRGEADAVSDPLAMLREMGSVEYGWWSPAARCHALAWLCDEAMSSATMNDLVRKVLEAREGVDRRDREIKTAVRQRIREQEARDANRGGASSRRVTETEMINARMEAENAEMKTVRQLGMVKVRLKPLGTDRERRRYWLLARGEDHRLFTELAGEWGVYSRVSQLKALHKWLDRRGTRERTMKAAVREHLITNLGVNAQELDPPDRRSLLNRMDDGSDEEDPQDEEQQYLGEPAEVAREKERERNLGREALRACGFMVEEQRYALHRFCR